MAPNRLPLSNRLPMPNPLPIIAFGLAATGALLLSAPAPAQSLRSQSLRSPSQPAPSANSVAAGPTSSRNSLPTPDTTGLPGVTARQSTSTGTGSGSAVSILGMPLRFAAPVTAPYNSRAGYDTFAGQPLRGRDAVLQQSIDGAP